MFDFLFGDSKKIKVLERTLEEKDKTIKALQTELSYHKSQIRTQDETIKALQTELSYQKSRITTFVDNDNKLQAEIEELKLTVTNFILNYCNKINNNLFHCNTSQDDGLKLFLMEDSRFKKQVNIKKSETTIFCDNDIRFIISEKSEIFEMERIIDNFYTFWDGKEYKVVRDDMPIKFFPNSGDIFTNLKYTIIGKSGEKPYGFYYSNKEQSKHSDELDWHLKYRTEK